MYLPVILGFSPQLIFSFLVLCVPVYFIWRLIFKKIIKRERVRKYSSWIVTMITTPLLYSAFIMLLFFFVEYYPKKQFDKQEWELKRGERFEYSGDIITSKMLIGKTKAEVKAILGSEGNTDDSNVWIYDLGYKPEVGSIDRDWLHVEFKNQRVIAVEQYH